jgi:hypothetical protein
VCGWVGVDGDCYSGGVKVQGPDVGIKQAGRQRNNAPSLQSAARKSLLQASGASPGGRARGCAGGC